MRTRRTTRRWQRPHPQPLLHFSPILVTQHDPLAPRAPTPQLPRDLPLKILNRLIPLVLVHLDALADVDLLLKLHLDDAADAFDFLRVVARARPAVGGLRGGGGGGSAGVGVRGRVETAVGFGELGVAVDLVLDDVSGEAAGSATAFDALIAFAGAGTHAAEVVAISRAPGPGADVHGVFVLQVLAARLTQPDGVVADAWGSFEGGRCEGAW